MTTKKFSTNYDNLKSEVAKVSTDVEAKMKDLVVKEVAKQVEVQVKMAYPPFLAEYHGPLYDFKKEFVERVGINARDVWVNTQKKMVMYKKGGNDIILAILRFDGSVVLTDDVDAAFFPDNA